jgi:hypothetical protein
MVDTRTEASVDRVLHSSGRVLKTACRVDTELLSATFPSDSLCSEEQSDELVSEHSSLFLQLGNIQRTVPPYHADVCIGAVLELA